MSEDSFTEITNTSWFSRIGGAIKGLLVGLILIIIAFPLLFWNEGRAVERYKTLKEGEGAVITVTSSAIDYANEKSLIHVTAKADTDSTLTDPAFGVTANALKLKREVEIYQWEERSTSETEKKVGGGETTTTTYTYNKVWSDEVISSADFKKQAGHQNSGTMAYESTQQTAKYISLGAFTLSPSLVRKIKNFEVLSIGYDTAIPQSLAGKIKLHDAGFYMGLDPTDPQVGDMRIKFEVAMPTEVSVIAKQTGESFEPYKTTTGGTIELLQIGTHSADAMIKKAQKDNKILTWILRFVGFILMFIGLNMLFKPLSVIADVLPILGDIVGAGTGIVSFLLAATLSLITIAIAWIIYRPLLGIILIAIAIGFFAVITGKLKSAKSRQIRGNEATA